MPQAILLEDVETLGERGTVVDVSAGYLRNYLLPRRLAEPATIRRSSGESAAKKPNAPCARPRSAPARTRRCWAGPC